MSAARSQNITLLHSYLRLDSYRSSRIPQSVLDGLAAGLAKARAGGLKVIIRVAYNWGPYPNSEPDADRAWITQHLAQLKPVFAANSDVLAFFEAGFIGAWGEWHTSTHGYDTDVNAKRDILKEILAAYPADRQVSLRYPSDVRAIVPQLTAPEAARVGNHQDCFGASDPDDWGTWGRDGHSPAEDKQLIAQLGQRHVVGGETCNADSPRAHCDTALNELSMMHFSDLNIDYEPGVIAGYKSEGCFDTLQRNLGYRFRLTTGNLPAGAAPGGSLPLSLTIHNDGWATPYNDRPVFAVLDGSGGTFPIQLSTDPRTWNSGADTTLNQTVTVPSNVPKGSYRLALWLPDKASGLRSNPAYSIRFANQNVWDAARGFNVLGTVTVGGATSTPTPTPTPSPTPTVNRLVVDDYNGTPGYGTHVNDLGKWTGGNSFVNGEGAESGGALTLRYNNSGWFGSDVNTSVAGRAYLVLRIKGAAGGEQNDFQLSAGGATKVFKDFVLDGGGHPQVTTSYQDIKLPLAGNGISASSPGQVSMGFWYGRSGTVTIDQISFE